MVPLSRCLLPSSLSPRQNTAIPQTFVDRIGRSSDCTKWVRCDPSIWRHLMIAAIYARKSTEQNGVADEAKSVTRQIDHARAFAARKGWTVAEDCIFVDDGISGAEFDNRPGFQRLMTEAARKPRPLFQVLIVSEVSRLGREMFETGNTVKRLATAGVRIWSYLADREVSTNSSTDKVMLSLASFADEIERERASQRTKDALQRKAQARLRHRRSCLRLPESRRSNRRRRPRPPDPLTRRAPNQRRRGGRCPRNLQPCCTRSRPGGNREAAQSAGTPVTASAAGPAERLVAVERA